MPGTGRQLDSLDLALLKAVAEQPKAGALELSRTLQIARGTVSARLQRLEESGVITGYGPDVGLAAAGFGVQAFVTLEISQGALDDVTRDLVAIPGVLEAFATTGTGDVLCRIAASSHQALQETLLRLGSSPSVVRSTSVVVLSELVPLRTMPLLTSGDAPSAARAPRYRDGSASGAESGAQPDR